MTDSDLARLRAQLIAHEGCKLTVYTDTVGIPTIGVGRNLKRGISQAEAEYLLTNDIAIVVTGLTKVFPWFSTLDPVRQRALIDMTFNLGLGGIQQWHNLLKALAAGDWATAATETLDPHWVSQVGQRAHDLAEMFRTGHD